MGTFLFKKKYTSRIGIGIYLHAPAFRHHMGIPLGFTAICICGICPVLLEEKESDPENIFLLAYGNYPAFISGWKRYGGHDYVSLPGRLWHYYLDNGIIVFLYAFHKRV